MGIFATGAATALSHLLKREAWARDKLVPFAGEVVELRCPPLPSMRFAVIEGGQAGPADPTVSASLVITAKPGMFAALSMGEDHLMRAVDISGNARLASEVLALLRYLRWDVEEDLARVVGDVPAHRIANTVRDLVAWQADAGRRLAENIVEYAVEERRMVVARTEFDEFAAAVAKLRDDVARLELRVNQRRDRTADRGPRHPLTGIR